jgi:hypothetical protein
VKAAGGRSFKGVSHGVPAFYSVLVAGNPETLCALVKIRLNIDFGRGITQSM